MDFSLEFFPPKTYYGSIKLSEAAKELGTKFPRFGTVTKTRSSVKNQLDVISTVGPKLGPIAPHILCGQVVSCYHKLIQVFAKAGADRLVILKGDEISAPSNLEHGAVRRFVGSVRASYGNLFGVEVAAYPDCHPQNPSPLEDAKNLLTKLKYGAGSAITQYFYAPNSYYNLLETIQEAGAFIPITPGVMPVISFEQALKFSAQCGSDIPAWIMKRLEELNPCEASIIHFGMMTLGCLHSNLMGNGIRDFHFYTLNNSRIVQSLLLRLAAE